MSQFTKYISTINNTQVDALDIHKVMPVYRLIEYSDNYSKIFGILWQFCRDQPALNSDDDAAVDFTDNATTGSFKIKEKIKILLKYLSNFWRTLKSL